MNAGADTAAVTLAPLQHEALDMAPQLNDDMGRRRLWAAEPMSRIWFQEVGTE